MDDHLGVAACAERKTELGQLGNEFLIVVNLAVVYDDYRAVFAVKRLLAGGQIDD